MKPFAWAFKTSATKEREEKKKKKKRGKKGVGILGNERPFSLPRPRRDFSGPDQEQGGKKKEEGK